MFLFYKEQKSANRGFKNPSFLGYFTQFLGILGEFAVCWHPEPCHPPFSPLTC
jgi:hypothetical protein